MKSNPRLQTLPCGRPRSVAVAAPSDDELKLMQHKLRAYLSQQNLKYTEQRWQIAESILRVGGHLDAQTIVEQVSKIHPDIGAATVYRNLKIFCEAGLLEASHQALDGRVIYEFPKHTHHDHIVCLDCGETFEFENSKIESLQEDVCKELHFQTDGHRHVIHGRCEYFSKQGRS